MRISELAKAAGVSLTTIHYYTREGLLLPSIKTAHNMAYYSQDCINDIRLIKELQTQRFLPLSVIKQIVQAKREGQATDHILDLESIMVEIFQPLSGGAKPKKVSLSDLLSASGLSEYSIKDLEDREFIVPVETNNGRPIYDDIDIQIARIFKRLAEFGLKPENFSIYREYVELIRTEFDAMHETFHQLPNHEIVPLRELFKITNDLKKYLALRIYRQEAQSLRTHRSDRGKDK
ncbi:MAG: MerR family transcriptional regulator [Dehalococcoidaceae bacterium]|nr:MerR family transcriptional regulator [Dehalococcoidaceae bacterium]